MEVDAYDGSVQDSSTFPNDWSCKDGDPRYILNLLARIVTVNLETMEIAPMGCQALSVRSEAR